MWVENKKMYHFNKSEKRKDIWQVGNQIDNTENYISDYWSDILDFNGKVNIITGGTNPFCKVIDSYLKKEQDQETYIRMLKTASGILKSYSQVQKELVLEEVRKRFYPELPSRKNIIYLCDFNQLEHWKDKLPQNKDLFKVKVTGNLFKSSDKLLPDDSESINTMFEQAKKYWEADFSNISDDQSEYLFQGKIKVLEKIHY
jgi:c-di-AMP phosphodiesterase-like protein